RRGGRARDHPRRRRDRARGRPARDPADPRRRPMTDAPEPTHPPDGASGELSHVRADGTAHMVDVTAKQVTSREATARAVLATRADVVERIASGDLPKGE